MKKKSEILNLNQKYGPLPAKAFPGRAAILLKVLNLDKKTLIVFSNSQNQSRLVLMHLALIYQLNLINILNQ